MGKFVEVLHDAALHLLCALVGEGHCQDVFEIIRAKTKGKPQVFFGQGAGLARACGRAVDLKKFCHA